MKKRTRLKQLAFGLSVASMIYACLLIQTVRSRKYESR